MEGSKAQVSKAHQIFAFAGAHRNNQIDLVADRPLDVKLAFSRLYLPDNLFHGNFQFVAPAPPR